MLNKKEFVELVAKKTGKTQKDSQEMIETIVEAIQDAIVKEGGVKLVGFGSFEVVERAARTGRNPQTGEEMEIPATKTPKFKASKVLKDLVKGE